MNNIKFQKTDNLTPVVIQDGKTKDVLMLGYMNEKAFRKTMKTGWIYFWSRKRKKIWMKGEESGNKLKVKQIFIDCDADALLIKVELIGKAACHTGRKSCFQNILFKSF